MVSWRHPCRVWSGRGSFQGGEFIVAERPAGSSDVLTQVLDASRSRIGDDPFVSMWPLKGVFYALRGRGDHIITSAAEHPAILEPLRFLERYGARVTIIPVYRTGKIDPEDVRRAITPRTILVSVMHANKLAPTIEVRRMRDLIWDLLRSRLGERVVLNGHPEERLPNTLSWLLAGPGRDWLNATRSA
jgi:cysteine sulfinate desulfinase/cysteine desulfurase-like protein